MMTDPTREEAFSHFGVKGQKWGVKTQSPSRGDSFKKAANSKGKKTPVKKDFSTSIKVAVVLVAVGARVTRSVLRENGMMPSDSVRTPGMFPEGDDPYVRDSTTSYGNGMESRTEFRPNG